MFGLYSRQPRIRRSLFKSARHTLFAISEEERKGTITTAQARKLQEFIMIAHIGADLQISLEPALEAFNERLICDLEIFD
jgi:hypothetical protein